MVDYELIDAHAHTYKSAEIGLQALGGTVRCQYSGTIEDIQTAMKNAGIVKSVMVNFTPIAEMREAALARLPKDLTAADREEANRQIAEDMIRRGVRRNLWSCDVAQENQSLVPLISVDPSMSPQAMAAEIEDKFRNHGAKGIKLHPPVQRFFADDRTLWPAYEIALSLNLPVVFHSGNFTVPDGHIYSRTKLFSAVLAAFPKLTIVLAHLGGTGFHEEALELAQRYPNAHFDCSAVISGDEAAAVSAAGGKLNVPVSALSDEEAVKLMRGIGVERVMFGTDFPFYAPEAAAARFDSLPFTKEEKRLIGAENAKRIFKI